MAAFYGKKRPLITDSEFENTVFLLKTTEVQDNNVFLDSSSNNVAITRVGNVSQGTFSPFSRDPGYWSNYFDGSGDYLTVPSSTNLAMETNDFTFEFWMYSRSDATSSQLLGQQAANFTIQFSTTANELIVYDGTNRIIGNISVGIWTHFALVRNGTTLQGFINGIASGSSWNNSGSTFTLSSGLIGARWGGTNGFNGYISNLRVIKGTALYIANFTPPTSPLTAISGTSLLTCQDHRFKDNSANNFTITRNGDSKVSTFGPFSTTKKYDLATTGSSIYINGAASPCGLRLTNNANLNFGLNDFTVEMWIYTNAAQNAFLLASHEGGISSGFYFYLTTTLFNLGGYLSGVGGFNAIAQPVYGSWNHIAWSRTSGTLRFFLNGVELGSTNASTWNYTGYPYDLSIGADQNGDETRFTGYMSNIRIVNGSSVYTGGNFTPPTSPVTAIANTVFLLDFKNQGVYDATGQNQIDTVNALSSNSITLFNKNTVYFDGSGDWADIAQTDLLEFGAGDFTIECWIYLVDSTRRAIYHGSHTQDWSIALDITNQQLGIWASSNGTSWNLINADPGGNGVGTITIPLNSWVHIVYSRNNNLWKSYVNGVIDRFITISGTIVDRRSLPKSIGKWFYTSGTGVPAPFNGYISELRITRGVDRYRQAFTVPSQNLESVTNTSLLTAQNTTFTDSSDNRFALTVNGDARTTVASPFATEDGNYSVYFDGAGDSLSLGAATVSGPLDLTSSIFTIEAWIFVNAHSVDRDIFSSCATSVVANSTVDFRLRITAAGVLDFSTCSGSTPLTVLSSQTVPLNQWVHVAATRNNTTGTVFVNGQLTSGTVHSTSNTNRNIYVGSLGNTTYFNGYISNIRVVKGTAVYTLAFTPPTAPLTAISNTSLLTCQSSNFKDSSSNNFAITPTGNVTTRKHSPFFNSGSVYFDGTGDRLATGYSSQLNITQGDFTIELWIYPEQANGTIMVQRPSSGTAGWNFRLNTDSTIQFWYTGGTTFTTPAITLNRWTHIACVRNGTAYTTYINGVSSASGTIANGVSVANTVNFYIGTNELVSGNFKGFMSNLRIVKGSAVYTGNFTPSTAPLTAITNTVLLTCQGDTITDYSNNHVLSTFENTSVIGFSPNDLGSVYFDGSGDYLSIPNNSAFDLGSSNFTLEGWFYFLNISGQKGLFSKIGVSNGGYLLQYSYESGGKFVCNFDASNAARDTFNIPWTTASTNTWYHIAFVRISNSFLVFVNGTQIGTTQTFVLATTIGSNNASEFRIGTAQTVTSPDFNGYISNIRVIKGTAVYTSNFTPPALEFPIRGTTS